MNEQNRSPAGGRGTAETAGRMKTHFAPSYFTFRVLTRSPTVAELLRHVVCRLSVEWNGVSLGTLMQLKRASFPMSMFCTVELRMKCLLNVYISESVKEMLKEDLICSRGFPGDSVVKSPPARTGDSGSEGLAPGSGRAPGGGNGNLLLYARLENPRDRGARWVTVPGVTESQTGLSR